MATYLKCDGNVQKIRPKDGKSFSLDELQKLVGGNIEIVNAISGGKLVINEEGKLADVIVVNERATSYYGKDFDVIVGDAVLVEVNEEKEIQ